MNRSDEKFVEEFVKEHEDLMEALESEEKHNLYKNNES